MNFPISFLSFASIQINEKVDVHSSKEFYELSRYINEILHSLLVNDKKMAYVLGKTDMRIGVYEYNQQMKRCMKIRECVKTWQKRLKGVKNLC